MSDPPCPGAARPALADAQRRLVLEIAAAANRARSVEAAVRDALAALCEHLGWPLARAWLPAHDTAPGRAPRALWWPSDGSAFEGLRRALGDAPLDAAPPHAAARAGLPAVLTCPVRRGGQVIAVLEFFAPAPPSADAGLDALLAEVGTHLGCVFERESAALAAQRLAAVVEHSDHAIYTVDLEGRIQTWNRGAGTLLGYREEDILGRSVSVLVPPEREAESAGLLRRGLDGQTVEQFETRRLRSDGTEVHVSLSIGPVHDRDGTLIAMSAVMRDMTAQKAVERELIRARDASEETARLKSEFLANMSHEIRTPMNGVLGMVELLRSSGLPPEAREQVDTMRRCADGLLTIINDILDFSKIEAGKLTLEAMPFDLGLVVEDCCALFAERAREKSLELACCVPDEARLRVVGDPTRLGQVLNNLLGNAVKFTDRGEVVVRVTAQPLGDDRVRLRFAVSDTGTGISAELRPRLFEPFVQADGSTSRRHGGTGLGLAISRQLVELMGGTLALECGARGGSTFSFALDFSTRAGASPGERGERILEGRRLLIVDDSVTNLQILGQHLAAWGCRYTPLDDSRRALDLLRVAALNDRPYELVLLDHHMPDVDGPAVAAAMRAHPWLARTPVLMLTSGEVPADDASPGREAWIAKPVRAGRLRSLLVEILAAARDEAVPGAPARGSAPQLSGRLLLVEDNRVNQMVAIGMLKKLGLEADLAEDGREALEAIAGARYDAVLMDCQMPGMDGFEATRRIRAAESHAGGPRLPVIAMTANAMQGDRERCLTAGMDDYLAKPVTLNDLATCVARWIGGEHVAPPAPGDAVGPPPLRAAAASHAG